MATAASLTRLTSPHLDGLASALADLRHDAREFRALGDVEQEVWRWEWFQLRTSFVPELEQAYQEGAMSNGERRRYRRLRQELKRLQPTIARLQLTPLPIDLDESGPAENPAGRSSVGMRGPKPKTRKP